MSKDETILMNENSKNGEVEEYVPKKDGLKNAGIAGAAGFAMGAAAASMGAAAATAGAASVTPEPEINDLPEENVEAETSEPEIMDVDHVNGSAQVDATVPVAQVDDGLSFGQAFRMARNQVGPGGVFVWHGRVYNTYLADEWSSMSAQEHADFASHIHVEYAEPTPTHVTVHRSDYVAEHTEQAAEGPDYTGHDGADPVVESSGHGEQSEPEVQILGVEHVTADDGSEYVLGAIGNEDDVLLLADVDNDGRFDLAAYDRNHNGEIEDSEVQDISDQQLSVAEMEQQYEMQQDMMPNDTFAINGEQPDFDNNVDILS